MPESGHVYVSASAPATTLVLSLEYSVSVDIYNCLAGEGVVEANAEFGAAVDPENLPQDVINMINATPSYLEDLSGELERTLNDVALADVCRFVDAMRSAGTPQEIGDVAWAEVQRVYDNVMGLTTEPNENRLTCIIIDVGTPGQGAPPQDPMR